MKKKVSRLTKKITNPASLANDVQGLGLKVLTKLSSSDVPDQLGMRKPLEKMLYEGSKAGFKFFSELDSKSKPKQVGELTEVQRLLKKRGLFDLSLTSEQQMARDMLRAFAKDAIYPSAHDADHEQQTSSSLLAQIHQLGLAYHAVPTSFGGMAGDDAMISQMLSLEDLGFGDFSIGAAAYSTVSVANVISRYGDYSQKQSYLAKFVDGAPFFATLATNENTPLFNPNTLKTAIKKTGSLYLLTGEKNLVMQADNAQLFVVSAMLNGQPELFLVDADSENISITPEPAMGLKAAATCRVRFNGVRLLEHAKLNVKYEEFMDLSRLATAALACGTGDAILDYVIPYVNEREAFGEPISHRQGVAFMISDMAIELESVRLLVWRAVARAQNGLPFHREAHLAHILATEKMMKLGTDGVQLLGGHGYTKEHPVERWYRDLRSVSTLHGSLCL